MDSQWQIIQQQNETVTTWTIQKEWLNSLCRLIFLCICCCYCNMFLLFCIFNCGSTTTDKLEHKEQNYTVTTWIIRTKGLNNLCRSFCCLCCCCCCYCVILLLSFCNWGCSMIDEQQQWHETVRRRRTTTVTRTTTQSNLHTLLSIQELIFWRDVMQRYPLVQIAGGQEEIQSNVSLTFTIIHKVGLTFWGNAIEKMYTYLSCWGIWWPRVVHQVSLTVVCSFYV